MDDSEESKLRQEALEASQSLADAEQAAHEMPPIVWGEYTKCATCDNITAAYKKYDDGKLVPICGACTVKEMDEYEKRQRERG